MDVPSDYIPVDRGGGVGAYGVEVGWIQNTAEILVEISR
jgi:hypothetical protein